MIYISKKILRSGHKIKLYRGIQKTRGGIILRIDNIKVRSTASTYK